MLPNESVPLSLLPVLVLEEEPPITNTDVEDMIHECLECNAKEGLSSRHFENIW